MLQDIFPHIFHNEFVMKTPTPDDTFCVFQKNEILLIQDNDDIRLPISTDFPYSFDTLCEHSYFLFTLDEKDYFLVYDFPIEEFGDWKYSSIDALRDLIPTWKLFICVLARQINQWFSVNRFCGRCGAHMGFSQIERAMECPECKHLVYPTLSPSVIVAVIDKKNERILLTKYAGRAYTRYALVAGYVEVGETLEQTVRREVAEEVGLKVNRISYYKSQPWPFSGTLLAGFYVELDGDPTVTLQESELCEGTWFTRDTIPDNASTSISLTSEMIENFRMNGKSFD